MLPPGRRRPFTRRRREEAGTRHLKTGVIQFISMSSLPL